MIKVYTTPTCIYCHALMNWLTEEKVDFQEVDANTAPGISAVPMTIITDKDDNNPIQIVGFNRGAITDTLKKYGYISN